MRNEHDYIPPDRGILAILFICAAISGFFVILGYDDNLPITVSPYALLCISLLGIYSFAKTIAFSKTSVTIKHILFTRTLAWDHVKGIEFARQRSRHYIFICLNDCPFWGETNMDIQFYTLTHPTQLIAMRVTEDQIGNCKEIVQKYCNNILMTEKD